jgi:hypothetical protein
MADLRARIKTQLLTAVADAGGGAQAGNRIKTESNDFILTEAGDNIVTDFLPVDMTIVHIKNVKPRAFIATVHN